MFKVPYNQIAIEILRIESQILKESDPQTISDLWDKYKVLLESSGWTVKEFDEATLKKVDSGWEDKSKN